MFLIGADTFTNDDLKANLLAFVEANGDKSDNFYQARREISLARLVLEHQIALYKKALVAFQETLKNVTDPAPVLATMELLEAKQTTLLQSVKTLTQTLKNGAEIESICSSKLNAVELYSIITQLPTMLENVLLKTLNDPVLCSQIVNEFADLIGTQTTMLVTNGNTKETAQPLIEEQVVAMLNTVPMGIKIKEGTPEQIQFAEKYDE